MGASISRALKHQGESITKLERKPLSVSADGRCCMHGRHFALNRKQGSSHIIGRGETEVKYVIMKRRMYVFVFSFFVLNIGLSWDIFKLSVHGKLLLTFMHVTSSVPCFLVHSHHVYNLSQ